MRLSQTVRYHAYLRGSLLARLELASVDGGEITGVMSDLPSHGAVEHARFCRKADVPNAARACSGPVACKVEAPHRHTLDAPTEQGDVRGRVPHEAPTRALSPGGSYGTSGRTSTEDLGTSRSRVG